MNNFQVKLAARPKGMVQKSDFSFERNPRPEAGPGQVLVKILYASLDPAMRGWMNEGDTYIPAIRLGDVVRAGIVGKVISSQHPDFPVGTYITGPLGIQEYAVSDGRNITKINPALAPLSNFLGILGIAGLTAYFAFLGVGKPQAGETVVVSGAAGAVGTVVGQLALLKGCRVVGIAGGPDKCAHLVQNLGFDAAIDYKNEDLSARLKETCPQGVDIYFDNVGGEILDTTLLHVNQKARIVACGAISQYNSTQPYGLKNYFVIITKRVRLEGMIVIDYARQYGEGILQMAQWMQEGKLKTYEHIDQGIEGFYETFMRLFTGDKLGKLILQIAEEE
ncbi:MAG: NADP-dependent oxidoreductase [Microscillaceae bacterium]|nr:NADP-dependent oxidoreductase [Microscillaceae bacterium]